MSKGKVETEKEERWRRDCVGRRRMRKTTRKQGRSGRVMTGGAADEWFLNITAVCSSEGRSSVEEEGVEKEKKRR